MFEKSEIYWCISISILSLASISDRSTIHFSRTPIHALRSRSIVSQGGAVVAMWCNDSYRRQQNTSLKIIKANFRWFRSFSLQFSGEFAHLAVEFPGVSLARFPPSLHAAGSNMTKTLMKRMKTHMPAKATMKRKMNWISCRKFELEREEAQEFSSGAH